MLLSHKPFLVAVKCYVLYCVMGNYQQKDQQKSSRFVIALMKKILSLFVIRYSEN